MTHQPLRQLHNRPSVAVAALAMSQNHGIVANDIGFKTLTVIFAGVFYFFSYWFSLLWRVLMQK